MLRPKLNRIWTSTNSSLRRDPGDEKYLKGWISEIPTYQVLNYLQYKVDTTLLAQAERGIFEWGSDIQYGLGSIVWNELDKKIYISTVGSPDKTKAPSANLSQWSPSSIQIPRASYDVIVAAISAHIADVTSNPHKLTAGMLNAYNKSEIDALVASYRALVSAHAADKNNPHNLTALQIGAVPSTGGTYTGDVTFNGGLYFDSGKVNQISKSGGLFLQSGNFVLGLNASGVAVAGTASSQSPIVTEQTFPTLKAAQEPKYAAPSPNIQMNLMGDINIQIGNGSNDASWDTQFATSGTLILPANSVAQQISYAGNTGNIADVTMAVDIQQNNQTSGVFEFYGVGFGGMRIFVRGDGSISVITPNVSRLSSPTAVLTDRATHRIVVRKVPSSLKLYVDGALVAVTNETTSNMQLNGSVVTVQAGGPGAGYTGCNISNLRIWAQGLTDSQISTL